MVITLETRSDAHYPFFVSQFIMTDTAQIDPKFGCELEALVRESRFFDRLTRINLALPRPDVCRCYSLRVQEGQNTHTLELMDPILDKNLKNLISALSLMA